MEEYIFLLIILGAAILAVILFFAINRQRMQQINRLKNIASLGFVRADQEVERISDLVSEFKRNSDSAQVEVKNLFYKVVPDGKIYLLDVVDHSEGEQTPFGEMAVLIQSKQLSLPRFSIYPKLMVDGMLGNLVAVFLERLYAKLGQKIEDWHDPEFERNYVVIGENETAIREVLNGTLLDYINGLRGFVIEFNRDMILLNQFGADVEKDQIQNLNRLVSTGNALQRWMAF